MLAMHVLGMSFHQFLMVGLAAVIFILAIKWLGPKTGIPAIAGMVERI